MPAVVGKIKLFADAHVFDNEYQGTRTYIKEIYSQLARIPELEIYLGAYEPEKLAEIFQGIPNIRFIKYPGKSAFTRLLYSIPELITRYRIDFAHFQYILPPSKKCTYIVTIHDVTLNEFPGEFSYPYRLSKKMLYRDAAKRADIITTVSAYSRRSIQKYIGTTDQPIHIIPNGVSKRFFLPYHKEISKKWIHEKFGISKFILYVS
ncbi:MAG TPA: glycosyltransferase, partial [Chitinophagaceae bacterium]|nr:glycosyltransferase [Chitinophagaceae bacterium]